MITIIERLVKKDMKKVLGLLLFLNFAFAFPPLQSYQEGSIRFNLPVSWAVQVDEQQGTIFLQENPNDLASPQIFLLTATTNNNSPKAMVEQASQNMKNLGMSNIQILESKPINNGYMMLISGSRNNQAVKSAFISFTNANSIALAGFSANSNRFDELGGVNLIYVTVGGQDPTQYADNSSNSVAANSKIDPLCLNPNDDIYYNLDYCVYQRIKAQGNNIPVDISNIFGTWEAIETYANILEDGSGSYQNTVTGEIIQDSSEYAVDINLYNNGKYEIYYLYNIISGGCKSSVSAYETGDYQIDGRTLKLANASFQNNISQCGQREQRYSGQLNDDSLELVFASQNKVFIDFDCNLRQYLVSCDNFAKQLISLTKIR